MLPKSTSLENFGYLLISVFYLIHRTRFVHFLKSEQLYSTIDEAKDLGPGLSKKLSIRILLKYPSALHSNNKLHKLFRNISFG